MVTVALLVSHRSVGAVWLVTVWLNSFAHAANRAEYRMNLACLLDGQHIIVYLLIETLQN